ncbi:hypothetical protein Kfla_6582 [Kribbella flavida DSM 17836]|uniref:DUF4232 domain-containing protein n=1 Tax=Kribbella flavida (strain DSM 17836 / JCM 10339 / NBRC 14399) TaxID=479435 RepID=D2PZL1_KRIFD|nr:DUF4232 domain-containing protein [Kribbella flavida]ADB35577.1 hypothetical protein Kfla_6582 [Kribbella flavida DSM 17836]
MSSTEVPEAAPGEVTFTLAWENTDDGLRGMLEAVNVSDHPVRLTGKPGVTPVGTDGIKLDTTTIVSLEALIPGYVVLEPGERATSPVYWSAWSGPNAGDTVIVEWNGCEAEAAVTGPRQPVSREGATNLSTSWFAKAD